MKKNKTLKISEKEELTEKELTDTEMKLNESFDWDFIFDREWSRTKK